MSTSKLHEINRSAQIEVVRAEVGSWRGVTIHAHRFGGIEFRLGRRELGKLVFLDLIDRSARIQLLCDTARTGPVDVDLGDIVGVTGNPAKARRGEPSIAVHELVLLGKIHTSLPDTFHGITDTEVRYRRRYLDLLMNEEARRDALVRSRMITAIRAYLDDEKFVEVETPILQPRYGGAFAEPFVTHSNYLDQDVYLRIADELYLKRLIVGGLERVYELAKDFRNEGVSYKHSPEFTQLEWYEAYADYRDTMERTETLVARAAEAAIATTKVTFRGHELDLAPPWRRIRFVDALEAKDAWSRDPDELRAKLEPAGVDTSHDRTWAQLVDHAYSHFVEPELVQPTAAAPCRRAIRVRRRWDGVRERLQRAERQRRAGGALRDAGRRASGRRPHGGGGRSRVRRGDVVRDAADRRLRRRHGPPRHGAGGTRHDP